MNVIRCSFLVHVRDTEECLVASDVYRAIGYLETCESSLKKKKKKKLKLPEIGKFL